MARYAPNKKSMEVKRRYFELIRQGHRGAAAARMVGVSTSGGSLWFLDAGGVLFPDPGPVSPRFLTQDGRIAIADGLRAGDDVTLIAAEIGKSFQTVYRVVKRNSKLGGRYQPWWAHNAALRRRRRPKVGNLAARPELATLVRTKLTGKWSLQQIARYLVRAHPEAPAMPLCAETIYLALFAGVVGTRRASCTPAAANASDTAVA